MIRESETVTLTSRRPHHLLRLILLLMPLLAASGCQLSRPPISETESKAAPETEQGNAILTPTSDSAPPAVTPTPAPPQPLILGVPPQWAQAVSQAILNLSGTGSPWDWVVEPSSDPEEGFYQGIFNMVLLPDSLGAPVGSRPLSLAVPLSSSWVHISLPEAEKIRTEGSPFISVMEWSDMTPNMRSLLVDGHHPSDPTYPLREEWSLHSSASFELAADELAPALNQELTLDPVIHVAAVGDVMLDRALGAAIAAGDVGYPFALVEEPLSSADLTIGNLESALGDLGSPENKGYTFRAPIEAAETLANAGFDVLSLANNHAMDFGSQALLQAIKLLDALEVATVGAGADDSAAHQPVILEKHGITLAILAYVDVPVEYRGFDARTWIAGETAAGVAWAEPQRIKTDVTAANAQADHVLVILHSGYENVHQPSPPQVSAAHAAIEAGASLVIGHHAHMLQPVELMSGSVIAYGLGNFAFEDAGLPQTGLLNIWIDAHGVRELELVPLILDADGRPTPANEEEARIILESFYVMSADFEGAE